MPLELGVWRIDKQLTRIQVSFLNQEQRLEDFLDKDPRVNSRIFIGRYRND